MESWGSDIERNQAVMSFELAGKKLEIIMDGVSPRVNHTFVIDPESEDRFKKMFADPNPYIVGG